MAAGEGKFCTLFQFKGKPHIAHQRREGFCQLLILTNNLFEVIEDCQAGFL
jgi:hypothetical protein